MKKTLLLLVGLFCTVSTSPLFAQVVISQVYGGGGTTGSAYKNDFVELFNRGTAPVVLNGWTIQYAHPTYVSWSVAAKLSGVIQPGHYYLVKLAGAGSGTIDLPTPNAVGTTDISEAAGWLALTSGDTAIVAGRPMSCGFAGGSKVINDLAYGQTRCGNSSAINLTNMQAAMRGGNGCLNWINIAAPAPRNGASPASNCGTPAITDIKESIPFKDLLIGTTASGSFTFMNVSLKGDVSITLPAGTPFSLSKDQVNYGNSITYSLSELNSGQYPRGIYVRFAPTYTGVVRSIITLASPGAAIKIVTLTGRGYLPVVGFASAAASIQEDAGTHTITLNLTSPVATAQTVTVAINDNEAVYGSNYTTNPDGSKGSFTLNIPAGSQSATFAITPDQDAVKKNNLLISFAITATSKEVIAGTSKTYNLMIVDKNLQTTTTTAFASERLQRFTASPNPTSGVITLTADNNLPASTIYNATVFYGNGRALFSGKGTLAQLSGQMSAQLSKAAHGLYTIRIATDKSSSQLRIVKL